MHVISIEKNKTQGQQIKAKGNLYLKHSVIKKLNII